MSSTERCCEIHTPRPLGYRLSWGKASIWTPWSGKWSDLCTARELDLHRWLGNKLSRLPASHSGFDQCVLRCKLSTTISAIRSPACPSHSGGTVPFLALPESTVASSVRNLSGLRPTRTLLPKVTVTGRSVLSRTVRQGTPR